MAVMGRKKRMIKRIIDNRRALENDKIEDKKEVTPEEEAERVRILREQGFKI